MIKRKGCQVLIVGAGITGFTIARELLRRGGEDILIVEKEPSFGFHASGRNSGVLHAGIYYTPDSLKAKFCLEGNRLMKEFCKEKGLALRETGKVVVVKDASEIERLYELKRRADACGARAYLIDHKELSRIEPYAATYEKALFAPDMAVIKTDEVLRALEEQLIQSGKVTIAYNTAFQRLDGTRKAHTPQGPIQFEKFVNAAGAYTDRIAHQFGVGKEYKILPFKGTYKKLVSNRTFLVRGNIYPVPDLRNPFLGVHFTRTIDDEVYIGPTAIPALGRENYGILSGFSLEIFSFLYRNVVLLFKNPSFRSAALTEPLKYVTRFFFEEARRLVPQLRLEDLKPTDKVGIRPQLVHLPTNQLVMDFVLLQSGNSLHILNAISPALTTAMAFAKYAVDLLLGQKGG